MTTGSAPGKVILFGEHAVVYGRPAIAVPVSQVTATATVTPGAAGSGCVLDLSDIGETVPVSGESTLQPLALVTRLTLEALAIPTPDWRITLRSTIPVSSGLGSGAAAATAIVRAVAAAAGRSVTPAQVSALVYESERLFHGTPSGIDNTVIAFQQPVWFVRGQPPEPFPLAHPLTLVIGDVSRMAGYSYEIVACSGNLTGTFAATPNLPGTWVVQYDTTPGAGKVTLVHDLGTILLFR